MFQPGVVDGIVADIAEERGWPPTWLNADVSMFASDYDDPHGWTELLRKGEVVVRIAPANVLVAMKLWAGRGKRDFDDLDLLLDHLGWGASEAKSCFDRFYPHDVLNTRSESYLRGRHAVD